MKWMRRIGLAAVLVVMALTAALGYTALRTPNPVGFELTTAQDAAGRPFALGVWYPSGGRAWPTTLIGTVLMQVVAGGPVTGSALPLVLLSHGNGGGLQSHADLAMALANAGYVVAAPMHRGDNYADSSALAGATLFSGRNQELHAAIDHMLTRWRGHAQIDGQRVGAFGFSAGGLTVLSAIGARLDMGKLVAHCASVREFVCDVLAQAGSPLLRAGSPAAGEFVHDQRIKAAVLAAPGLGFAFDELAQVQAPVQLWSGERDDKVPYATNARLVRAGLGARAEFHAVRLAGHTAFLAPCGLLRPPALCSDAQGFDRGAFHAAMNAQVVAFFARTLKPR